MSSSHIFKLSCLTVALLIVFYSSIHAATYLDDIGYTALTTELGGSIPTGSGITVVQIEAPVTSGSEDYEPDPANVHLLGKTFNYPTFAPAGGSISSHATSVAGYFYGNASMTSGVTNIWVYEANSWLSSWLKTNNNFASPLPSQGTVQNLSWTGTTGSAATDTQILARYDYAIKRDNILAVTALNNGTGAVPTLMASGYNSIVVGLSNANDSYGNTSSSLQKAYANARQKPDIVVPASVGYTSYAAPVVSSAATFLLSSANGNTNAMNHNVIKATLMAGATKSEFGGTWSHTSTSPLDAKYGAGELNVYNSYHIQQAGEFNGVTSPSSTVGDTGWDMGNTGNNGAGAGNDLYYFFDIGATTDFSAILTWDLIVTPTSSTNWSNYTTTLANLDLYLYNASGFTVGSLVTESISSLDNVELLWLTGLGPGRYAMEVTSNTVNQDFALAWQAVPEPSTWSLIFISIFGIAIVAVRKKRHAV